MAATKPKKERSPRQSKQVQLLPAKIIEVDENSTVIGVQEKMVVATDRKKIVVHEIVHLLESLLVRVSNLELQVRALKKT